MSSEIKCLDAARVLLDSTERFQELEFEQDKIQPLLDSCAIIALRQNLGPNRPPIIGFIGCTGTGKSTLFNSIVGQAVSSTSWHAHNTSGPVLAADVSFQQALEVTNTRLLPSFTHKQVKLSKMVKGNPNELVLFYLRTDKNAVYIDLPDINTTKSRSDNQISLQILPWLDTAVFLTDDETVYHRDYEEPVQLTGELQQNRICALVNRGRDKVDLSHHDIQSVREFFDVETLFILPDLNGKEQYSNEPEFSALQQQLAQPVRKTSDTPMLNRVALFASNIVQENKKRLDILDDTGKELKKRIDTCISKPVKIPMEKILQDEVLHVLHHLGLRRFAVSNVLHFLRSMVSTGSIKRSFTLAFGENRGTLLESMLQFDEDKLVNEVSKCLADYAEEIDQTVRNSPHSALLFQTAPAFRSISKALTDVENEPPFRESLVEILRSFESECKSLLQADTIESSVKNDPLVAVTVLLTLIADIITIPGIGSFLLVPSAFSFLPMGKFDKAKKKFQRAVRDVVQTKILQVNEEFMKQKTHFTLDPSESAWKALTTCAEWKEQ